MHNFGNANYFSGHDWPLSYTTCLHMSGALLPSSTRVEEKVEQCRPANAMVTAR